MILQFVTFYRRINPDSPPASPTLLISILLIVIIIIIIAVWICRDDN